MVLGVTVWSTGRERGRAGAASTSGQEIEYSAPLLVLSVLSVSGPTLVLWLHVVAACIWIGGQVTVAAVIPLLRGRDALAQLVGRRVRPLLGRLSRCSSLRAFSMLAMRTCAGHNC